MRIAVTGATGFIGSHLCRTLERSRWEVTRVDLRRTKTSALVGADAVVHLAAIAHRRASAEDLKRVNVQLTRQVGDVAAAAGASLVFLSSAKVHGEISRMPLTEASPIAPQDPYGASKARAEEALRAIPGLRLAVLRPTLVYGPGVKANFFTLMKAIDCGLPLPLRSVENGRSLVYVGNLVDAIIRCVGSEGRFLISDGASCSTRRLCDELGKALGRPARLFPFPRALLPAKLASSLEVDDSRIRRELAWRPPFSFEEGLRATAQWYRSR